MWWTWLGCVHPATPEETGAAPPASLDAASLAEALKAGRSTPEQAREEALARIEALDRRGPDLRAVIALDRTATAAGPGPLYGLPVLIKDNVDVRGLPTTAGSLALARNVPPDDAFLVARIREAGAVVLGKTNLSEWANFRSDPSSSGWSAVGGQARNPYVLDRSPCGSSSGSAVAVAAGYVPLAVGSETDGSILCPSSMNGIVGVKPTIGLVSRDGVVPISHDQDTAGPMARTVRDAALLLQVMAAPDPSDPATARRPADLQTDYLSGLSPDALRGVRIGAARKMGGFGSPVEAVFEAAVADLERLGAEVVDVPLTDDGLGDDEEEVLFHDFRPDVERYLAAVDPGSGMSSLQALIAFDQAHTGEELAWFGQENFEKAAAHPADEAVYEAAAGRLRAAGPDRIDGALKAAGAVAIVVPTAGPAWPIDLVNGDHFTGGSTTITAVTGYPAVTVPMGQVHGLPVGLTFLGTAFDEARLLALAYAYEQGTHHAAAPGFRATVSAP